MRQQKVIRDGRVAVLYSPGFGAGWSTWADEQFKSWAMYAPAVVAWVEDGKVGDIEELVARELGADSYFYVGGADGLRIEWLAEGTSFLIDEYDGSESIQTAASTNWSVA